MRKRLSFLGLHLLCLLLVFSSKVNALDYYWVGGSGNWSDHSNHWATSSGGNVFHSRVPSQDDNVFFDVNSFSSTNQKITVDQTIIQAKTMSWSGVSNMPTFSGTSDKTLRIYGSVTLVAGMNFYFSGLVNFEATLAGQSIISGGKSFSNQVYFNGVGGEWTLQDEFSAGYIYLQNGTLNTNNQKVTGYQFVSNSSTARSLILGSSVINLTSAFEPWSVSNTSLMTLDAGTSTINMVSASFSAVQFSGGQLTYNSLNFVNPNGG